METAPPPAAPAEPVFRTVTLDHDIRLGDQVTHKAGSEVKVRKPGSGEMRGLTLLALSQLDVAAVQQLLPRITMPMIAAQASIDPADLMQLGGEIMDFLLPTAAKQAA